MLKRLMRNLNVSSHVQLLKKLHVDIVDLRGVVDPECVGPVPKERILPGEIKENIWGIRTKAVMTATGIEECYVDFILSKCQTIAALEQHRWPSADWFDFSDFSKLLDPWQNYAVMASGASVWQHPSFLRGMETLMVDLLVHQDMADIILDKFTDFYVAYFDKMFSAAPGKIDILRIADDLGTQHGLLFSVEQFKAIFAPRFKKLIDMAHSHNVKVMFHSCGSIMPFIQPLIDIGADILDPIQVSADRMDPKTIKTQYGNRICLHGSIDTQFLLPYGSVEDVRRNVQEMIDILGYNGGFILAPCHVLQTDVPLENIIALYNTDY
jgi:uroporphyrinogen decarboxylase